MVSRPIQRVVVALSAAAMGTILLAACFSANDQPAQPNPTFGSGTSATPGLVGMPGMSPPPQRGRGTPPAVPAGPDAVDIDGFAFAPATLTVPVGSTVTWTNEDDDPHTVVADGGAFRSQALTKGGVYSFTFPVAGTFDYDCSIHPFMRGTVVVTP